MIAMGDYGSRVLNVHAAEMVNNHAGVAGVSKNSKERDALLVTS
jgi:hypothetical protein